ncbi:DNA N-6-adenine-methyltransferase [uncultured Marinobacter sp.]|uniref:DNA N-6-adenine-methyltransferase n=1 Tax=uncultured Marinobacter sp. TaxID=187379 RepID=UPI00258F32F9|nr:DNA N-6-adenine-methyltransferase [uncultured Marinobacter sp.]
MTVGMGSHQSSAMKNDEWLTPPEIIEALGTFYLDPCSPGERRPWDTAAVHYDFRDNGLSQPWGGRVWLNPPYGREAAQWLERLAAHGNGIALIFARTETDMFFRHVWEKADAILFLRGRLHFHYVTGERAKANSGAPSCLVAYGANNVRALKQSGLDGRLVTLRKAEAL